jgi:hypothetical protein
MGRYAFFSTGLEYKFSFAVQESQDIWEFGGEKDFEGLDKTGYAHHSWTASTDAPEILVKLRKIEQEGGYPELDFTQFSQDPDGTWKIREVLGEYLSPRDAGHCFYELGCIIYHQLLYEPLLSVEYEL